MSGTAILWIGAGRRCHDPCNDRMFMHFDAHPLFERVPLEELKDDPCVEVPPQCMCLQNWSSSAACCVGDDEWYGRGSKGYPTRRQQVSGCVSPCRIRR